MSSRGVIKGTRLEPETGYLQYFIEHPNGVSQWFYDKDKKFKDEFGDLVKKYVGSSRRVGRTRSQRSAKDQKGNKQNQSYLKPMSSSSAKRLVKVNVKPFQQSRNSPNKIKQMKKSADDLYREDDGTFKYSLYTNPETIARLLMKSNHRPVSSNSKSASSPKSPVKTPSSRPSSLAVAEPSPKVSRKTTDSPSSGKSKETSNRKSPSPQFSVQTWKRKLEEERKNKERRLMLKPGFARSHSNHLINFSPQGAPLHRTLYRSSLAINASDARPRSSRTFLRSPRRIQENIQNNFYTTNILPVGSFLSKQPESYSGTEGSEAASTSTNSGGPCSSGRRSPKRQVTSGPMSQSQYSQLILRHRPGWTQLWLNTTTYPQNSINLQVCKELIHAITACVEDSDTYLVLISSLHFKFCSGIDFQYLLEAKNPDEAARELAEAVSDLCTVILHCRKPIFMVVNGPAVGIGVGLCLLADVVYATEKATFSTPYVARAVVPEAGLTVTLEDRVGKAMAQDMLLAGRQLTPNEALHFGLISRIMWSTTYVQEMTTRFDSLALGYSYSPAAFATKFLLQSDSEPWQHTEEDDDRQLCPEKSEKILQAIDRETLTLPKFWTSSITRTAMRRYLERT